eukprot:221011-Amphidinium_carterae.1
MMSIIKSSPLASPCSRRASTVNDQYLSRHMEVVASPVYDHFSNLCRENGVSVVRAHNQGPRQFDLNATLIVDQQRPKYSMTYLEQWFTMRTFGMPCKLQLLAAHLWRNVILKACLEQ